MIKKKPFKAKTYEILDSITSDGNQYIKLGVSGNGLAEWDVKFKANNRIGTSWSVLFGHRPSGSSADDLEICAYSLSSSSSFNQIANSNDSRVTTGNVGTTTIWRCVKQGNKLSIRDYGEEPSFDGTFNQNPSLTFTLEDYLFAMNVNNSVAYNCIATFYYLKYYANGVLDRDLIPVKRLSDNAIGVYDRVRKQFYANAGTGTFSGQSLSTPEYIEEDVEQVDYIENIGTTESKSYIDVGLTYNNIKRVVCSFINTSTQDVQYGGVFGAGNSERYTFPWWTYSGNNNGNAYIPANFFANVNTAVKFYIGRRYECDATLIKGGKNTLKITTDTGQVYSYTSGGNNPANWNVLTENCTLFRNGAYIGKVYTLKLYDHSNVLVRDFIPVKYGTEYCLLDLVENKLYHNAGTGSFSGGDVVHKTHIYKHRFVGNNVEYEELNYIESTGTQSIKLGNSIPFNTDNTVIECDFQYTEIATDTNAKWLFSNQGSSGNMLDFYSQVNTDHNGFYLRPSASQTSQVGVSIPHDTNKHHMKADFVNKKLYFDDDVYTLGYTQSSQTAPMYLFRRANTSTGYAKIKLFNFKYTRVLHHDYDFDLIPAKRVSDGVIGLYNKIDKTFLTNAGTGTFVSGERIEKVQSKKLIKVGADRYRLLDYIESNGSQYINTGIKGNEIYGFELDILPKVVKPSSASIYHTYMSTGPTLDNFTIGVFRNATGLFYRNRGDAIYQNDGSIVSQFVRHKITSLGNNFKVDNTTLATNVTRPLGSLAENIKLLGNYIGDVGEGVAGQVYSFKLYGNNNVLILDLIPVERVRGNVVGMLDLVNGTFYGNSGTGSFTKGDYVEKLYS